MNRFVVDFEDIIIRDAGEDNGESKVVNGGAGSGNFGHSGRPGEVGGSSKDKLNYMGSFKEWIQSLDEESEGEFSEELGAIEKEFYEMGLDLSKIKLTTKVDDLPQKSRNAIEKETEGLAVSKKNGQGMIYMSDKGLYQYGYGSDNKYDASKTLGEQPHNTSTLPLSTLRHELGHMVHNALYVNARLKKITGGYVNGIQAEKYCHQLVEKALGQKIGPGFHTEMSFYGTKNWREYIAESFANPNFSSHTRKIYDYCVKEMKKMSESKKEDNSAKQDEWMILCDGYTVEGRKGKKKNDTSDNLGGVSNASGVDDGRSDEQTSKIVNGGAGSGNFGHAGRPGQVGGSAPKGGTIAQPARQVSAEWLKKNREFVKAQGFTDKWIDEQVKYLEEQRLKERASKAKTVEEYDAVVKEMEASDHDYSIWLRNVGDPTRASLVRKEELKKTVVTPEQQKAVDDLLITGIEFPSASEKWLRQNSPQELVEGITSAVKQAEKDGLDLSQVRLKMTDAELKGGSCTIEPLTGTIKVFLSKKDFYDLERTASLNAKKGPDGDRWWTNGNLDSASSHEFGHALAWQAVKNQGKNYYEYQRWCQKIVSTANDRFAKESGEEYWSSRGKLSRNKDYEYISRYGTKNSMEIIAESHSNPDYSRYTKIVNDVLLEAVRGDMKWT